MLSFFAIDHGKVTVSPDSNLLVMLSECLTRAIVAFNITSVQDLAHDHTTQLDVFSAIFDSASMHHISKDSTPALSASISGKQKAQLLAQGISGIIAIASQLMDREINSDVLARRTAAFQLSSRRREIIDKIEKSEIFEDCTMRIVVEDLILEALGVASDFEIPRTPSPSIESFGVDTNDWDYQRPAVKMGLPWGFTIMALN